MNEVIVVGIVTLGLLAVIAWTHLKARKKLPRLEQLSEASDRLINEARGRGDFTKYDLEYYTQHVLGQESYMHGLIKLTDLNNSITAAYDCLNEVSDNSDALHQIIESLNERDNAKNNAIVKAYLKEQQRSG